jgi:hypothetical protein
VRSGIRDAVRAYQKIVVDGTPEDVLATSKQEIVESGDVCGVFYYKGGTYYKAYAEWGDRMPLPDTNLIWAVCLGLDALIMVPDGATCVYVSPFGVVFGYE